MSWCLANDTSVTCCSHTCSTTMRRARTYPWTRTRRSHALSRPLVAYSAAQSWADCITTMSGSNLRQAQVARGLIPGEGFRDLARDPFCRGVQCYVDPDKLSTRKPNDDQNIEQIKLMVGTTNRSMAAMCGAWLRRKVPQP